jgi:hypothetical protein
MAGIHFSVSEFLTSILNKYMSPSLLFIRDGILSALAGVAWYLQKF